VAGPTRIPTASAWVGGLAMSSLIAVAAPAFAVTLGVDGTRFAIDGQPAFLLGFSYYGALGAPEEFIRRDLDDLHALGFSWFRVWATWSGYQNPVSAVDEHGEPRPAFMARLRRLIGEADQRGMVVDVTLSRGADLPGQAAHLRAVEVLAEALKPYRNLYFDLANERNIKDARYVSFEELAALRTRVKQVDPDRLATASHGGDLTRDDARSYLETAGVDFLAPHRPRHADSPRETEAKVRECLQWASEVGRAVPVHCQEPFRRGYSAWQPQVEDFLADLRGAAAGGAAGWCFHNGGSRDDPNGRPRRSFDLRAEEGRLMSQLDPVEREVVAQARGQIH